jgi:Domain of unknown function (DUF1963)
MSKITLNLPVTDANGNTTLMSFDKKSWIEKVFSTLSAIEIAAHYGKTGAEIVQEFQDPIVSVGTQMKKLTPTLGQSKIGGKPHVPQNFEWPCEDNDEDMPLQFIAQINLEELSKADFDQLLPSNGMIWFFSIADGDRAYGYEINEDTTKVIFEPNIGALQECNIPEILTDDQDATIEERVLIFGPCITFDEVYDSGIEGYLHDAMRMVGGQLGATQLCYDFLEVIDDSLAYAETPEDPIPVYMIASFDGYFIAPNAFGEGILNFTLNYLELEKGNLDAIETFFEMGT